MLRSPWVGLTRSLQTQGKIQTVAQSPVGSLPSPSFPDFLSPTPPSSTPSSISPTPLSPSQLIPLGISRSVNFSPLSSRTPSDSETHSTRFRRTTRLSPPSELDHSAALERLENIGLNDQMLSSFKREFGPKHTMPESDPQKSYVTANTPNLGILSNKPNSHLRRRHTLSKTPKGPSRLRRRSRKPNKCKPITTQICSLRVSPLTVSSISSFTVQYLTIQMPHNRRMGKCPWDLRITEKRPSE